MDEFESLPVPERKKMMQGWADHLDALRTGAKVVAIGRVA